MNYLNKIKLENISEISQQLENKGAIHHDLVSLFKILEIPRIISGLKIEKDGGMSASGVILMLLTMRFLRESIGKSHEKLFNNFVESNKNCFYNFENNENINWRGLLISVCKSCIRQIRQKANEKNDNPTFFIFDDTTIEKSGLRTEKTSKVFDHTTVKYVLGYKLLAMSYYDGRTLLPLYFSFHREKHKDGKYGMTSEQVKS